MDERQVSRLEKALGGQKLGMADPVGLCERLARLLPQLYVITGFQMPKLNDVMLIARKLAADLVESYPFLSYEEVELCFEWGAKGLYGDFMGLNLKTFNRWLMAYKTSEARYRGVVGLQARRVALPAVSASSNQASEERFLQEAFRRYRQEHSLERVLSVTVYQRLQTRGLIAATPTEKRQAMAACAADPETRRRYRGDELKEAVKRLAMERLLRRYFENLIARGATRLSL